MKVLWFEVTTPSKYKNQNVVIGGWQDSLEAIVREIPDIELSVAFPSKTRNDIVKNVDGVTYIPIYLEYTLWERFMSKWTWDIYANKVSEAALNVVKQIGCPVLCS